MLPQLRRPHSGGRRKPSKPRSKKKSHSRSHPFPEDDVQRDLQLHKQIGEGGFGKVYLATLVVDPKTQQTTSVAVKRVPEGRMDMREIDLQSKLSHLPSCHRYVACIYDHERDPISKDHLIIMEYIRGPDLFQWLLEYPRRQLSVPQLYDFFKQLLRGLKYIHGQGIAHGDIKMENIMVDVSRKYPRLKYIDLGFGCDAKACETSPVLHGTRYLTPPEAFGVDAHKRGLSVMKAADLWALGTTLAEVLMLRRRRIKRASTLGITGERLADAGIRSDEWRTSRVLRAIAPDNRQHVQQLYDVVDGLMNIDPKLRISADDALKLLSAVPVSSRRSRKRSRKRSASSARKKSSTSRKKSSSTKKARRRPKGPKGPKGPKKRKRRKKRSKQKSRKKSKRKR